MKTATNSVQCAYPGRGIVILFLVCSGITFLTRPETTSTKAGMAPSRALTFSERIGYQYAIEEVYWRHRIWPQENRQPKPVLDALLSREQVERKVTAYLCKSQVIADQRWSPITASELRAEVDRMASHTKQPDVLRELFEALGNDPFVIAECLARPILAERLASECKGGSSLEAISGLDRKPIAKRS